MGRKVFHQYRSIARDYVKRAGEVEISPEAKRAQDDFPFFCAHITRHATEPKVQPEHMQEWNQHLLTGKDSQALLGIAGPNVDILSPRGSAKAQPLDEPILTPDGWVEMGDLRQGDLVFSADGTVAKITAITPQGFRDCYKVVFTDGSFTYCSDDHLWSVRNLGGSDPNAYKTVSLNHIRTRKFVTTKGNSRSKIFPIYRDVDPSERPWLDHRGYAKYHIPIVDPIQFPEKSHLIDPYLLGVLIGDGNLTNSSICFSTGDLQQIDELNGLIPDDQVIKNHGNHPYNFMISRRKCKGIPLKNPLIEELKNLGLWGKRGEEKFIPKIYLLSSVEQRIALLQGLLDTDGTVAMRGQNSGGGVSFCTTSKQLRDDVVALVNSLGGVATLNKPQRNKYSVNGEKRRGRESYKVGIKFAEGITPFRLDRKAAKYRPCTKLKPTRGIVDIEKVSSCEMQCITIDHPSQLYLTRNYIVTHNSTFLGMFAAWSIGRHTTLGRLLKILYISYTVDVARPKSAAIKAIIESPEYREVFPSVIPGKKWSDEYWAIDYEFAGISTVGEEVFTVCCAGLKGAIVSKRCLVGDVLVRTDAGDFPIGSFGGRIGQQVLTYDESTRSLQWRRVLGFDKRKADDLVEVTTRYDGRRVRCTSDHPFYVSNKGYIDAINLAPDDLVMVVNDSGDQGWDRVESVVSIDGPEMVYDIEVEGTHNFFANGICVHNSHLILLDDLIKSEFDIANPDIREQMQQNWTRSILPTMLDGGRAVCLGTRFRADDIHCTTFTEENGWVQIEQSAILDDPDSESGEKTYWDFWSLEHLQTIRTADPIGFSFQYQNKIIRTTEVSIHPDWIKKGNVLRDMMRYEKIGLGIDLSSKTKERHDYSVFVLGGRIGNRYYILDMWRGRLAGNKSKLEKLLGLLYEWDVCDFDGQYIGTDLNCYLWAEDVAYQASLQGDYKTFVRDELGITNLIYKPVHSKADKLAKLRSVTGLFENGLVMFNESARLGVAIDELVSFGATAHDDCADAIVLLLNGLRGSAPLDIMFG